MSAHTCAAAPDAPLRRRCGWLLLRRRCGWLPLRRRSGWLLLRRRSRWLPLATPLRMAPPCAAPNPCTPASSCAAAPSPFSYSRSVPTSGGTPRHAVSRCRRFRSSSSHWRARRCPQSRVIHSGTSAGPQRSADYATLGSGGGPPGRVGNARVGVASRSNWGFCYVPRASRAGAAMEVSAARKGHEALRTFAAFVIAAGRCRGAAAAGLAEGRSASHALTWDMINIWVCQ